MLHNTNGVHSYRLRVLMMSLIFAKSYSFDWVYKWILMWVLVMNNFNDNNLTSVCDSYKSN